MATIISTKTSGVGGLSVTGDASGILQLASADGTTALTIDASQNVGIGTSSPSSFGKFAVVGSNTGGAIVNYFSNSWTTATANTQVVLSLDPGGNGYGVRDCQIRAINNGGNQNSLTFYTSNAATPVEALRIDYSGNVGIGSTPAATNRLQVSSTGSTRLLVENTTNTVQLRIQTSTASALIQTDTNHPLTFAINNGSEVIRLDTSYNLLVGRTSTPSTPSGVLGGNIVMGDSIANGSLVIGSFGSFLGRQSSDGSTVLNTGQGSIIFSRGSYGATTPSGSFDSSGNLLVGTTSVLGGTNKLCLLYDGATSGGLLTQTSTNVTYTAAVFKNSSGTGVGAISCTSSATSFVPSSDIRLKTNIIPISNGIERVLKLNPVDYNWISDGSLDNGFIAQELLDLPEFKNRVIPIGKADDGSDLYGVDYMKFVSVLTAAIQELKVIIDTQQEQINSLLGK